MDFIYDSLKDFQKTRSSALRQQIFTKHWPLFPFFRSSIHNLVFIIEMEASTSASFYEYRVNRDRSRIPTVILTRYFIQCTWFPKNATQSANRTSAVVACWNNQSLPFNRHKQFFIQLFFSLYIVLSIAPVYGGNHFRPKSISIETIARVQQQYLGGKLSADMKWVIINFRRKSYKKPTQRVKDFFKESTFPFSWSTIWSNAMHWG